MPELLDDVRWITDQAANAQAAFKDRIRYGCIAHEINTTLKHAFDADFMAEEAPEMQNCIMANRKAVKYLKKSGNALKLDHAVQGRREGGGRGYKCPGAR